MRREMTTLTTSHCAEIRISTAAESNLLFNTHEIQLLMLLRRQQRASEAIYDKAAVLRNRHTVYRWPIGCGKK